MYATYIMFKRQFDTFDRDILKYYGYLYNF